MFTGIVEELGPVAARDGARLRIDATHGARGTPRSATRPRSTAAA